MIFLVVIGDKYFQASHNVGYSNYVTMQFDSDIMNRELNGDYLHLLTID